MTTALVEAPEDALADLVREYGPRLRRFADRLLHGSGADPDDVLQEVWLRAHRSLPQDGNRLAWLYAVTRNCATDARRAALRAASVPVPVELVARSSSLTEDVEWRVEARSVLADVAELGGRQRDAFVRHVLHGTPHEQVAGELALTPQASKSLVLRARRELHRCAQARRP